MTTDETQIGKIHVQVDFPIDDLMNLIDKAVTKALNEFLVKQKTTGCDPDKLYRICDVMKKFDVSRVTIYQWEKKGLLKSVRIGNLKRFKESDIQSFIELYNPHQGRS